MSEMESSGGVLIWRSGDCQARVLLSFRLPRPHLLTPHKPASAIQSLSFCIILMGLSMSSPPPQNSTTSMFGEGIKEVICNLWNSEIWPPEGKKARMLRLGFAALSTDTSAAGPVSPVVLTTSVRFFSTSGGVKCEMRLQSMESPRSLKQKVGPWKSSAMVTGDDPGFTTSTRSFDVNFEYALSMTALNLSSSISFTGRKRRRIAKANSSKS
mmetsp:Transcript_11337/g.23168  ORF Transcript_11337/g.23168 Transcript_11337/m.23168 type:complete len:212 (-) Transcript_11337:181-816(-)